MILGEMRDDLKSFAGFVFPDTKLKTGILFKG